MLSTVDSPTAPTGAAKPLELTVFVEVVVVVVVVKLVCAQPLWKLALQLAVESGFVLVSLPPLWAAWAAPAAHAMNRPASRSLMIRAPL
jgi:hypothetical protein